jgi:sortase A
MRTLLERLCWGAGLLLLAAYAVARVDGAVNQQAAVAQFDQARAATAAASGPAAASEVAEPADFTLWSAQRVAAYEASFTVHLETPLAMLEIPRLKLRVAVLDGTDDLRLNRGVGRVPGTARPGQPGNLAIAGHRDGFFRVLKDVVAGDEVRLTTLATSETYVVERTWITDPSDVHVLDATTKPSLTLITCYPFYFVGSAPQRFVVRAQRSDSQTTPARPAQGGKR